MKLATLPSLVAVAGAQSASRGPLDSNAGSDFGALLGGMAKDAPGGTTPSIVAVAPPTTEATDTTKASAAGAPQTGDGDSGTTGSQQKASLPAEGEPQLSDTSVATAAPPVVAVSGVAGVASLLTLAARAAEPAPNGAVPSSSADGFNTISAVGPEAKGSRAAGSADGGTRASGRAVRRASTSDADDPAVAGAAATAAVPTALAASLAATGAIVPATVPDAADTMRTSSTSDGPMPTDVPAREAGINAVPTATDPALPAADDAFVAPAAFTAITTPTDAPGENESATVRTAAAISVDAAIVPGSVRVESHLGFDLGTPVGGVAAPAPVVTSAPGPVVTGAAAGAAVDASQSAGPDTADLPSPVALVPAAAGTGAGPAGASPSRTADTGDTPSSNGLDPSGMPSTATLPRGADAGAAGAKPSIPADVSDIVPSAGVKRLDALLPSSTVPEPALAAVSGAAGTGPLRPTRAPATASSAGVVSLAVPSSAKPVSDVQGSAPDPTDLSLSPPASTDAASTDEGARSASLPAKPALDEPMPPVADAILAAMATPAAAMVMQTPLAALPVAQQVADGVVGLAATVVPNEPGPGTTVAPARTMALQLSPAGLGTLTVRLHVAGRGLDVHLEASDGRTAALIDRDRDTLSGALRGKDYQLQTLTVTTHDATMPGGTHAERGTDPRSADTGSADAGSPGQPRGGSSRGRSGDGGSREAPDRTANSSSRLADDAAFERGGSSLFV